MSALFSTLLPLALATRSTYLDALHALQPTLPHVVELPAATTTPGASLNSAGSPRLDQDVPFHIASPAQLSSLLSTHAAGNVSIPLNITLPVGATNSVPWITLLLWLPPRFAQRATAWPTVFHLHGADEGVDGQCSECYWPAAAAPLRRIAGHGLPHRIEYRTPFNEQFVLVSPQRPPTNNITGDELIWLMDDYILRGLFRPHIVQDCMIASH